MKKENPPKQSRLSLALLFALLPVLLLLALAAMPRLLPPAQTVLPTPTVAPTARPYDDIALRFGRGYGGDGWQVYFTEPRALDDHTQYHGGLDSIFAQAIDAAQKSLDIASFDLSNPRIIAAILAAHERGIAVRLVIDDESSDDEALDALFAAGAPIIDDQRSGRMHNKFAIIDAASVWTGSWNYTMNGPYRHNNNALVLSHPQVVAAYQAEFNEMFERREFGTRSTDDGVVTVIDGARQISLVFAAEADEIPLLANEIRAATSAIRFMVFAYSLEEFAAAMIEMNAKQGISVQGVFDEWNSKSSWSQMPALHCAGVSVRQDGNRDLLHHKVIIIDDDTVITGSFNFSKSAASSNDENIVILRDPIIASLYLEEFQRVWDAAQVLKPDEIRCD